VEIDGRPALDVGGEPVEIDAENPTIRYDEHVTVSAAADGEHLLVIEASAGGVLSLGEVEVLPPARESSLPVILGGIAVLELLGAALAVAIGPRLAARTAAAMTTKRTIVLALVVYAVIAVWGFFLDAVIEFWMLAWLIAVVQGGSQALSRSLYASMSPAAESGEFFGFFSVMSKFSSILGPLLFAGAVAVFGNSRPAVLSIAVFFVVGIALLARVDVDEGRRVAREADAELMAAG
jgi:MFS family permease